VEKLFFFFPSRKGGKKARLSVQVMIFGVLLLWWLTVRCWAVRSCL